MSATKRLRDYWTIRMRLRDIQLLTVFSLLVLLLPAQVSAASPEAEVRSTVQQIFGQLKSKNFEALYDSLPSGSRSRMPRDRFTSALRRSQDMYALERIEIGKARVSGNLAVVDTTLYGHLLKPFDAEGKIVAQQYLVREDGRWKVATGDNATIRRFLEANSAFGRQFPIRQPRVFVKKDGGWTEFTLPKRQRTG